MPDPCHSRLRLKEHGRARENMVELAGVDITHHVQSLNLEVAANDLLSATLTLKAVLLDVEADVDAAQVIGRYLTPERLV